MNLTRDMVQSTLAFEAWLRGHISVREPDLQSKHQFMAEDIFRFFRGTFYRWCEQWPTVCPSLANAEPVLAIGDLHVQNFGSWRDGHARLIWGVNDYDEVSNMAFTADLVRLIASAELAAGQIPACDLTLPEICEAVRDGYSAGLKGDPQPFVLEHRNAWLLRLVRTVLKEPKIFWRRWLREKTQPVSEDQIPVPLAARLRQAMPKSAKLEFREMQKGVTKGLGSLGHQRFFCYSEYEGGPIALEGKSIVPSSVLWATGKSSKEIQVDRLLKAPGRPSTPHTSTHEGWLVRPVMSDCGRIDLSLLSVDANAGEINFDQERLLFSMGFETANLHQLSKPRQELADRVKAVKLGALKQGAAAMLENVRQDFKVWRKYWRERQKA
ncbi:MAG: DUF2252 family protein [Verrucomicrobia bacterium]|nr:DUF2252 family protein [Verrucomicrobiota bacterium]